MYHGVFSYKDNDSNIFHLEQFFGELEEVNKIITTLYVNGLKNQKEKMKISVHKEK